MPVNHCVCACVVWRAVCTLCSVCVCVCVCVCVHVWSCVCVCVCLVSVHSVCACVVWRARCVVCECVWVRMVSVHSVCVCACARPYLVQLGHGLVPIQDHCLLVDLPDDQPRESQACF